MEMHYTDKNFCPYTSSKECHLFSTKLLFQFGYHDNHGNLETVFPIVFPITDCVNSLITSVSQITEIRQIVSFLIMK